ncbi:MAG: AAA family ATPase [Clostridia bacterium]|nr:AAA family ATPase [Clostridia bacterium]
MADRKDEIIAEQLDIIRSMTERNLSRVGADLEDALKVPGQSVKKPEGVSSPPQSAMQSNVKADGKAEQKKDAPAESVDDLISELDSYIGLTEVKSEVKSLVNLAKVFAMRRENGLPTADISLHMVFSGNPGTGKTMIARFMARVYHAVGVLTKGHLVETDRSALVGGYVGQTAIKTAEVLKSALGGVFFIDEAYTLTSKSENDFGQEAVDTVLKYMEDHRDDIVVIVAGYVEPMRRFIASNPGLESRFNKYVDFADYTAEEMLEIFKLYCKKSSYVVSPEAVSALHSALKSAAEDAGRFGNGRGVRNLYEKIIVAQANRLAALDKPTKDDLSLITGSDVTAALESEV